MLSTKDYDKFKLRDDNRDKIDMHHVNRLARSIQSRNMMDLNPIIVNQKMEIINGQHRYLAAKQVGETIYYIVEKDIDPIDMLKLQLSKAWTLPDYLNYFVKHDYEEYKKLAEFMKTTQLSLRVALMLLVGRRHEGYEKFREGEFVFNQELADENYLVVWESVDLIETQLGKKPFLKAVNFWKALITMFRHPDFELDQWRKNLNKFIFKILPQVSQADYLALFEQIYNHRCPKKIDLTNYTKIDESEFVGGSQKRMSFHP